MNRIFLPFLLVITAAWMTACDQSPVFPLEPQIEFMDIQPRRVEHLKDSIVITFRFQDGDGDLGSLENNLENLFLIDSRIGQGLTEEQATNKYTLQNLTPDARKPSIQGEISVVIPLTINLPQQCEESVRYEIQLFDRAGNQATPIGGSQGGENRVYTAPIEVFRDVPGC
ncbi:MAG: hypothetical protein AAF206_31890 [Bacteroidota bacterium]